MPNLVINRLSQLSIPVSTAWLMGTCMEFRGKQDLWIKHKPEVLDVLREKAIIQSVESSNRIEGVTIARHRLRPVVLEKARPKDRSEEELAGYKRAIDWIADLKYPVHLSPVIIQKLHEFSQGGFSGDAGQWKTKSNEIIEILPNGERKIRFIPTSPEDTPDAVLILCQQYQKLVEEGQIPILLLIATFVFDLLCIHPFRDGNGRVSRLATTLLLQSNNFNAGLYISLERLVEQSKDEYYDVLARCSIGWHDNKNDIIPWWNYFLSTLRQAYKELQQSVESAKIRPVKTELVKKLILQQVGPFALADLSAQLPTTSSQLIKKVLSDLKESGKVRLTGKGRGALWLNV